MFFDHYKILSRHYTDSSRILVCRVSRVCFLSHGDSCQTENKKRIIQIGKQITIVWYKTHVLHTNNVKRSIKCALLHDKPNKPPTIAILQEKYFNKHFPYDRTYPSPIKIVLDPQLATPPVALNRLKTRTRSHTGQNRRVTYTRVLLTHIEGHCTICMYYTEFGYTIFDEWNNRSIVKIRSFYTWRTLRFRFTSSDSPIRFVGMGRASQKCSSTASNKYNKDRLLGFV